MCAAWRSIWPAVASPCPAERQAGGYNPEFPAPSSRLVAAMPSFDITSEINKVELHNALDQSNKEISTRFDFKGSDSRVEEKDLVITLFADDDFKLKQVTDVLNTKCAKRGVDVRAFDAQPPETISGGKVKQAINVRNGIDSDTAKKMVRAIKDAKIKVQASIQGEAVRVSGAKKDDLQGAIQLVRKTFTEIPLQFGNFRD
jgi:uncharacterized protein YajQ (UPF0234 family)